MNIGMLLMWYTLLSKRYLQWKESEEEEIGDEKKRRTMRIRRASHAGSWYSDDGEVLHDQLQGTRTTTLAFFHGKSYLTNDGRIWRAIEWLRVAQEANAHGSRSSIRAIIAPHAGFT